MKRKTILTLGAAATAAVIGALTLPAIAGGPGDWGPSRMMQMMHGQQAGFMDGHRGPGMMMRSGFAGHDASFGPMQAMTDNPIYKSFDTDADGSVSATELEAGVAALHAKYDADGNGALNAEEFAALFAEATRGMADRPFTMLDANADGAIDADEMAFPAQMMARMQKMQAPTPSEIQQ
ncbi:calcium-binding protein [Celeribacter sp.]|uniref:calcium-binding protein n=1 Tax=Celeribacter sp. TaxID=1890673 RepID=UPI003A9420D0